MVTRDTPEVGDTLYRVDYRHRFNPDAELTPVTVTKVGRDYIYIDKARSHISSWEHESPNPWFILFASPEDMRDWQERENLAREVSQVGFTVWRKLTVNQLREIAEAVRRVKQ